MSFADYSTFLHLAATARQWVLDSFGWLFLVGPLAMLILSIGLYISPFGRVIIGGPRARPLLTRWQWFVIALCSGIGIGIVFFPVGETMHYLCHPPESSPIAPGGPEAALFAMSKVYLHWTLVAYAMYVVPALMFAFAYYNMKRPFSLGSLLGPLLSTRSERNAGWAIDALCLFALVTGMASSFGAGLLLLSSGLHEQWSVNPSHAIRAVIAVVVVGTFTVSAITGLHKGIRWLSTINTILFIGLIIFIFVIGPTRFLMSFGFESVGYFVQNFPGSSLFTGAASGDQWPGKWTMMLFALWIAWTPILSVFLGRIAYGYSVRMFVFFNLVLPSFFGFIWLAVFGGTVVHMQIHQGAPLFDSAAFADQQFEQVIYAMFGRLPLTQWIIPIFIFTVFLSFVTCAEAAISAMSGLSSTGISPQSPEPSPMVKIIWGLLVGAISWIMVSFERLDGISKLSLVGGLPAMILCLAAGAALIKVALHPQRYDTFQDGYEPDGRPKYVSERAMHTETTESNSS